MRVLQIHNRYRVLGGEDAVLDLEADLLEAHGHEVERFTVSNESLGKPGLKTGFETVWSERARREVSGVLGKVSPDLVHVHNTFPVLSPSIYWAAPRRLPVVQTLHNYRLACVNASLLRSGAPCEDCVGRRVSWPGVLHKCYRDSAAASGAIAAMQAAHRAARTFRNRVDAYVALTRFARSVMVKSGLPEDLVHVKPNFVSDPGRFQENLPRRNRILFVGRLSYEKGVDLLLDAWKGVGGRASLVVVGDGPERAKLRAFSAGLRDVEWRGWLSGEEVRREILSGRFVVLPSRWYEGFPMVVVEAFSTGTPVIAPDHGGFPEIVSHGETGFLFKPGDRESLREQLSKAAKLSPDEWRQMSEKARGVYLARYTPEANYEALVEIYTEAARRAGRKSAKGSFAS